MLRRMLLITLVIVLALPMAEATDLALAKKRAATVKKTFTSDGAITIPDRTVAYPYPSIVTVKGLKRAKIIDVNVVFSQFSHDVAADVDMLLVAPNGRNAMIMSDAGEVTAAITLRLDDSAPTTLPKEGSLSSGSFQPINYLESFSPADTFPYLDFVPSDQPSLGIFDGDDPNGEWKLYVLDDAQLLDGYIDRWSLEITAKVKKKHRRH